MRQVDEFRIDDGDKITMREIDEIFASLGYEMSKI
jgi:hypothetical protein